MNLLSNTSPQALFLKNGHIIDPKNHLDEAGHLFVHEGKILAVGKTMDPARLGVPTYLEFDLAGKMVAPGLIDMHVHLREPGRPDQETIETGSRAAARGGFTSILAMPNTSPPLDEPALVQFVLEKARRKAVVNVYPAGCITQKQRGESLTEMGLLKEAGAIAVTDDGHPVMSAEVMRRALEYARGFGLTVIDHCEDKHLAHGGAMNEGATATFLGLKGIPPHAETIMVARNIQLARNFGPIHLAHISTRESVELIRRAKAEGIPVTAEVTPHHLALTEQAVQGYNTNAKMNPPLRREEDIAALIEGLKDGTIDCIASDHAPHTLEEKQTEFDLAPFGVIGLETTVPVVFKVLIVSGALTFSQAITKLALAPAQILKLDKGTLSVGADADITILDPNKEAVIDVEQFESKSRNSPFHGWQLKGFPVMTLVGGQITFQDPSIQSAHTTANKQSRSDSSP